MKNVTIKLNEYGAVDIINLAKMLESTKNKDLELVRRVYPYKIPHNYISWRVLSSVIAMGLSGLRSGLKLAREDFASYLHSHKCSLWFVQNAPIYCLKQSILDSLLQTDIIEAEKVLCDLQPTLPSFILLFPKGSVFAPDGSEVEFCIVHLADIENPSHSHGSAYGVDVHPMRQEHDKNLHWSSVDSRGTVWFSGAGLYTDGRVEFSDDSIGRDAVTAQDKEFLSQMRSLVLQCFLLLQYEPEAIMDVLVEQTASLNKLRGFSKPKEDTTKYLYPRWLSEPGRKKSLSNSEARSHSSPATHWRRGHWRRVAVGEGRIDRKWVRIKPTLINP